MNKYTQITFTTIQKNSQLMILHNNIIQAQNFVKYFGLHLDKE